VLLVKQIPDRPANCEIHCLFDTVDLDAVVDQLRVVAQGNERPFECTQFTIS
jgi:hypothetical protein